MRRSFRFVSWSKQPAFVSWLKQLVFVNRWKRLSFSRRELLSFSSRELLSFSSREPFTFVSSTKPLLLLSLLGMLLSITSCASKADQLPTLPPMIEARATSERYNMQLDFMKHHFSGMLIVRQLPDNEIRILATSYFGLSLFDFSLRGETFTVNSCIEPMKKEKVLKLLEADFKNLFLTSSGARVKEKSSTFEKRITGKWFGKSVYTLSEYVDGNPTRVLIKHPWIRLKIQLDVIGNE